MARQHCRPGLRLHCCMQEVSKADANALKKRQQITPESWKTYKLSKGPKFALEKKKPATDLTHDMLKE